ncbi:MAE_28990/MAE_18760 family HEPN-like nuclease [Desulfosarcina variabilis]|uniref:MAE_28990/MAE_18760 family HEPN-like nuclease n=1 Tax=Desulfosarcina variabilis TaxID=2300 RepID=UPI003AFB1477
MPYSTIRAKVREMFSEVLINLAQIESFEPKNPTEVTPPFVKIQRGLYYVHLYSVLERTVNDVVEHTILSIKSNNIRNKHFESVLNVISLNPKMQAFKSCGYKDYINKSIAVFRCIDSDDCYELHNTIFSKNLQNIWFKTIQELLSAFGIAPIVIDPRIRYTVDEITQKRNAVAHGRETPLVVGQTHRANILRLKTNEIQLVANIIVDLFEDYIKVSVHGIGTARIKSTQDQESIFGNRL